MIEKVTFAASTKGKEAEIHQTFSIAELNLEEGLSDEEIEDKIQELFKKWYSIQFLFQLRLIIQKMNDAMNFLT